MGSLNALLPSSGLLGEMDGRLTQSEGGQEHQRTQDADHESNHIILPVPAAPAAEVSHACHDGYARRIILIQRRVGRSAGRPGGSCWFTAFNITAAIA